MNLRSVAASFLAAIALTACWIPEKFTAKIKFHPDAGFDFQFDGTAWHELALMDKQRRGSLSAKTEAAMLNERDRLPKVFDVSSAQYLGSGRFQLSIAGSRKAGEQFNLLEILSVVRGKDGTITVNSPKFKYKDRQEFDKLGLTTDGVLEINLPAGARVISHNAQVTPGSFGNGAYIWKINAPEQRPMIRFKIEN